MSARAANFLDDWIDAHVPVGIPAITGDDDQRPHDLADALLEALNEAGIPEKELDDECSDLVEKMFRTIDAKAAQKPVAADADDD